MSKKKWRCRLSLVLLLLLAATDSPAAEKKGAEVVVRTVNGRESRGELIAVKPESLLLKEAESGVDLSVKTSEISSVTVVRKAQTAKWALLGAAACGIAFPAVKYYAFATEEAYTVSDLASKPATEDLGWLAVIGVGVGALAGAIIGSSKGHDDVFTLEGDPGMREVYLQRLRYLARIKNPG